MSLHLPQAARTEIESAEVESAGTGSAGIRPGATWLASVRRAAVPLLCLGLSFASAVVTAQTKPAASPTNASAPALDMKPGLWETTALIETSGTSNRRTVTSRACLSGDDVKSLARIVPQQHEAPMKCENRDIRVKGGAVDWRIVCTGPGASMSGPGKMTVAADSFKAQANLDSKAAGKTSKVEQTITGKWLSECK